MTNPTQVCQISGDYTLHTARTLCKSLEKFRFLTKINSNKGLFLIC